MLNSPDIALEGSPRKAGILHKAGMSSIEALVQIASNQDTFKVPATVNLHVNLKDAKAKGIHMSRLYLLSQNELKDKTLDIDVIKSILDQCLQSHVGLSSRAYIEFDYALPLEQKALVTDNVGLRNYSVSHLASLDLQGNFLIKTTLILLYSSTCPCSAALSRELIQNKFLKDFEANVIDKASVLEWLGKESSIVATPHGQRSEAKIEFYWKNKQDSFKQIPKIIHELELSLTTPVQTAVKREDEQEFARLNGENLMFAEDAARILLDKIESLKFAEYVRITNTHFESLHSHNAQAIAISGDPQVWGNF